MGLSDLASIAIIVQGCLFIVSIILVWVQLRENTRLVRASNAQKLVELSVPFNFQLAQSRELTTLWRQGMQNIDELDEIDRERYFSLLNWWLMMHESIFHQWKRGLVDADTFRSWTRDLEFYVERQQLANHWDRLNGFFEASFSEHVTVIINRQPHSQAPEPQAQPAELR